MIREIEEFAQQYKKDFDRNMELDQSVLELSDDYAVWEEKLRSRSIQIREIFKSNEENIAKLKALLEEPLNEETANDFFTVVQEFYSGYYDDIYVMKMICDPLIAYYTEKDDFSKLIYLYAVMAFENFEFHGRIAGEKKDIAEVIACYEKVMALAHHYKEIPDKNIRLRIVTAYSNMIAPIGQLDDAIWPNVFRYYDEILALYESSIKPLGDMTWGEFMVQINLGVLSLDAHLADMSKEDTDRYTRFIEQMERDPEFEDTEGNLYRAKQALAIFRNEKTVEEVIGEYIAYIKELPLPDYEKQDETAAFHYTINYFNCAYEIFALFERYKIPKSEQPQYTDQFVDIVTRVMTHVPYSFMTTTFNEVCAQWFTRAEQYVSGYEKKRQLLFDMILCRQPATYIHSLMVRELSVMIAEKLLVRDPSFFDDIMRTSHEKMIAFIGECAIMHDLGKCAIAGVINKQARKLSDFEFDVIRMHPQKALEIVNNDPDFLIYMDVMLGHHKSYDGGFGYPRTFDKTSSDIASVIDLVTICDAMDAATDIYGRNYTAGKNFDTLYQELLEGKGVKYCPEIVDLIGEDKDLYRELKDLTENRRGGIYYNVYQQITKIKAREDV